MSIEPKSLDNGSKHCLVTGAAGFIGSHLVEGLLRAGRSVVGIDDLSTGSKQNLSESMGMLNAREAANFHFIEGSIHNSSLVAAAVRNCSHIFHLAAIASVERCERDPKACSIVNEDSFQDLISRALANKVERVVFASSSAIYGDNSNLPLSETERAMPLSRYAASKARNEQAALEASRTSTTQFRALRFFNVFGPRQDPSSPYSGVMSIFARKILRDEPVTIFGDGLNTRDFVYVRDVVRANILAAFSLDSLPFAAYNVATGNSVTLLELIDALVEACEGTTKKRYTLAPIHTNSRLGDIRLSAASIQKISNDLGFRPQTSLKTGISHLINYLESNELR